MNSLLIIFFISYGIYSFFNNFRFWIIYISLILTYYYITQVQLSSQIKEFLRRKITIATWSNPFDPQTYTSLKLNITKIIPYLEKKSKEENVHITPTIFSIKLMAIILKKYPEVYGYIKYGKYNQKDSVDICCLVQVGDGKELANTTIKQCEVKNFHEITEELKSSVDLLRKRKNKDQNKKMNLMYFLPTFILGPVIQIISFLSSIGLSIEILGLKKFEFGSCVITSIGSLGIDDSYAPIPPLTFAPLLLTLCSKYNKYYYNEQNEIQEKIILKMNFTSDYRFFSIDTAKKIKEDVSLFFLLYFLDS